ncbi:unnamed protein product, partial [Ixodes persulcatus]
KGKLETDSATVEGQEQSINTPVQRSRQLQKAIPHQGNKTLHLEAVHLLFQDDDRNQSSLQKNSHSQQAPPVTVVQPSLQQTEDTEKAKECKVLSEGRTHPPNTRQADKIRTLSRQITNLPSAQKDDRRGSSGSEENNEPEAATSHHSATTSRYAGADKNGVERLNSSTLKLIEAGHGKGKGERALGHNGAKSRTTTGRAEKRLKEKLETESATVEEQGQ